MAVYETKNPTKDGRKYYFRIKYKDIFGVTHDYSSQKFKRRIDAINEEAKYRIKVSNQEVCTSNITFHQIFLEYKENLSKKIKKQTMIKKENLYKHLKSIDNLKINDFDLQKYKQLHNYIESMNFSIAWSNKILELLKALIRYSSKYYNTSDSMLKFIENFKEVNVFKKEMDFFTYEEYLQFDHVIDDFEFHVFFEILYFLGLRQGEAQALTWKDINFEKNEIFINKTLTTKIKGEKWTISTPKTKSSIRTLPLTKNIQNDLKSMLNTARQYKDFSNNWFIFGNTRPFVETTIQNKKNLYCDEGVGRRIRVHDFRHSCASLLINKGATIALVSKYLGHSNISITLNTYTHMYKNELENVTNILDRL